MRRADKEPNCMFSNVEVETVGGSVVIKNLTSNHKVLGADGKFHKAKIIRAKRKSGE